MILSLSCSQKKSNNNFKYLYYKKGEAFIKNEIPKIEKQNNLFLNAHGINIDKNIYTPEYNAIHDFYFTFFSLEKVNLQEARKILINSTKNLLHEINNNKEISNYLYSTPFTHRNLDLGISFFNKKGKHRYKNYISGCAINGNTIYYKIAYPNGTFARIHEESYDEALKIVEGEKSNNKNENK